MRNLLIFILFAFSTAVYCEDFFLEIEKSCTTSGNKLEFKCTTKKGERHLIFSKNGKWFGRNANNARELAVVKNDKYILVLENPVYFSGTDRIFLLKATGKFYWAQFAYSDVLNESEGTVKYGSIVKVVK
jgi:hypothetical protein